MVFANPTRAGLYRIAQEFKVPVESLLFVGDERLDMETAETAGCSFVRIARHEGRGLVEGERLFAGVGELAPQIIKFLDLTRLK